MAPIYSQQLCNKVITTPGAQVVYTVPTGATLVLTDVDTLMNYTAAAETSFVEIGAALLLYNTSTAAAFTQQQWRGRQVLTAGQQIGVDVPAGGCYIACTGYVLT